MLNGTSLIFSRTKEEKKENHNCDKFKNLSPQEKKLVLIDLTARGEQELINALRDCQLQPKSSSQKRTHKAPRL